MIPNVGDIVRVISPYLPNKDVIEFSGKVLSTKKHSFGVVATILDSVIDGKQIHAHVDYIVEISKHSTVRSKVRFFLTKAVDFLFG